MFRLFGIAPYLKQKDGFFRLSHLLQLYGCAVLLLLLCVCVYLSQGISYFLNKGLLVSVFAMVNVMGGNLSSLYVLTYSLVNGPVIVNIINKIVGIGKKILSRTIPSQIKNIFWTETLLGLVILVSNVFLRPDDITVFALLLVISHYILMFDLKSSITVWNLQRMFYEINQQLKNQTDCAKYFKILKPRKRQKILLVHYVDFLRKIHFELSELTVEVNLCFARVNLVNISISFFIIIHSVYMFLSEENSDLLLFCVTLHCTVFNVIKIIGVVDVCTSTSHQVSYLCYFHISRRSKKFTYGLQHCTRFGTVNAPYK